MTYRTFNPWGHVSKADRLSRLRTQSMIWAHGQIMQKVENGSSLFEELQEIHIKAKKGVDVLTKEEKIRYNEICDIFVGAGISEDTIETALG
jgi:hypothetical protein